MNNPTPSERQALLDLIPLYVLGGLSADEQAQVKAFVAHDAEAQALLRDYQQVADRLLQAVPLRTPPLGATERLRQRLHPKQKTHHHLPLQLLALAAILAVVLGGMVVGVMALNEPTAAPTPAPPDSQAELQAAFAALDSDADTIRLPLIPRLDTQPIEGMLLIAATGDRAIIRVENMPALTAEQTFQLWLTTADGSNNGGIFRSDAAGVAYVRIPLANALDLYQKFTVSIEPATGSPLGNRASGPRVFEVALVVE